MNLTQQHLEACRRIEAKGGPSSYAESLLYHAYSRYKKEMQKDRQTVEKEALQLMYEIARLEKEVEEQCALLDDRKARLHSLLETHPAAR